MGMLDGKVAIITGAGRGLGYEEALAMAREGCKILVNDLGAFHDGTGESRIADEVVKEIKALGVEAVANYDSVTDFQKTEDMVKQAINELGGLDIVVNNAGILRDRMSFNMTEAEFDAVIAVHLKGTFNLCRHAGAYFRQKGKADPEFSGRIINTTSEAGLLGNLGQSNYGAAKAGIAAMTIILAGELRKYATVNCITPVARTRLTTDATPQTAPIMKKMDESGFDIFHPRNAAPLVVFLASDKAKRINGEVFKITGDKCWLFRGWHTVAKIENNLQVWTPQQLAERIRPELMRGAPKKQTIEEGFGELVKM